MIEQEVLKGVTAVLGIVCVGGLTGPALKVALNRARLGRGHGFVDAHYADEDGAATEESIKAHSDFRPRVAVWLSLAVGLGAAISSRVLAWKDTRPADSINELLALAMAWSGVLSWGLICLQSVSIPFQHQYLLNFRLAVYGLLSSLVLASVIAWKDAYPALGDLMAPEIQSKVSSILSLVQLAAAVAAACAFAGFPRRPDVYDDGVLVDQERTVSLLGRLSYSWNMVVFDIAKERQMKISDLPTPHHSIRSRNLKTNFLATSGDGRLWRRLLKIHAFKIIVQWMVTIAGSVLSLFPQLVLYKFLQAIERRGGSGVVDPYLFVWASGLLFSQAVYLGFKNWSRWVTSSWLTMPVMSLLGSLVFTKALQQYDTAVANHGDDLHSGTKDPAGNNLKEQQARQSVINLMTLDSGNVTVFFMFNSIVPTAFTDFFLAGAFLVRLMGWKSILAGLGAAALVAPFSSWFSKSFSKLTIDLMMLRDSKANLLTEALQGMRQIKYSGLERLWEEKILAKRNEEMRQSRRVSLWQYVLMFFMELGPVLLACVSFSVYAWENGTNIQASVIFTSLDLLGRISSSLALFPILQMFVVQAWTSCTRLEKYLSQADRQPIAKPGHLIAFERASVAWPKADDAGDRQTQQQPEHSMLRDISLEFPTGKLSVVTGKTGSGKSLLLAAVLGEVKLLSGSIYKPTPQPATDLVSDLIPDSEWIIPSLTAFVSQTPWIESGTLKENITYGLPFDESRYQKVLQACALAKDIEQLLDGEQTQVGPKGVTLSGGQRWRLALARALYSRAGIIILDDVLSAVDSHVGRVIVEEGLTGELAAGRTRILATHHPELVLPYASYLVRLREGILESAEDLTLSETVLSTQIDYRTATENKADAYLETETGSVGGLNGSKPNGTTSYTPKANRSGVDIRVGEDEEHELGRVKWKVYKAYYDASGAALYWTLGLGILLLLRLSGVAETWSLKEVSESASSESNHDPTRPNRPTASQSLSPQTFMGDIQSPSNGDSERQIIFWLGLYVLLHLLGGILRVAQCVASLTIGLKASQALFQQMTHAVLRAPLRWTDTIPSGRILNRFTSDMSSLEYGVSGQTLDFISSILQLLVIIGASLSFSPYVIFFGIILVFFYIKIASKYIIVAREIRRISSTSQSPVLDQFSSVLSGLSTIRAFGRADFYMSRMHSLIDNKAKAEMASTRSFLWLSFRLGMLGVVFVTVVAYAVAVGGANAALAGFSLTFALQYTGALGGLLHGMTSIELGFNAVERVVEYAEIETEPEGGIDAPAAWPTEGRIEVDHLTVSYAEGLPDVLQDVNFTIGAGERVGVVGRTGAGKSTLAAVLFRLLEPKTGSVRIDNIDISTLKLDHLRSRLAIIPQDPFLFSGTLRSNLDMEGHLDDYDLHQALQRVHLVEEDDSTPETPTQQPSCNDGTPTPTTNKNLFANLSHPITSGGANLSQGQRQLCCLARALLRRPKLVVLDEATSAVDRATDAAIQISLRREFAGCTVLVVAHRLSTVADFDRLLVLDGGRVAEMGTPEELLRRGMEREEEAGDVDGRDGAKTDNAVGDSRGTNGEFDGTGAFWELVKKSAEKEKLMGMIFGKKGEAGPP